MTSTNQSHISADSATYSVLGNPKVRYDAGFSIAFYILKILALVSPYSVKPKVGLRYVSDFKVLLHR